MSAITESSAWLMAELLKLEPGTQNGGIYANKSGYHNTRRAHLASRPADYSIQLLPDKMGPPDKAAAYDWTFPEAQRASYTAIAKYMNRLINSGKDPADPRLNGWRECYGQADTDTYVEGWDFYYGVPVTSDPSHLWHIHLSELRQYTDSYDNKRALLSVLRGESVAQWRDDDMSRLDEVLAPGSDGENRTTNQQIHDLHEAVIQGNGFVKDEYTRTFIRRAWEETTLQIAQLKDTVDEVQAETAGFESSFHELKTEVESLSSKLDEILDRLGDGN